MTGGPDAAVPAGDALRLVLWQCAPLPVDTPNALARNLSRLDAAVAAVAGSADLLITPEMFVCGYGIGADAALERSDVPAGPIATAVADLCARHRVAVLYGCSERRESQIYNTIRLVDAAGDLLGAHHKTHLFGDLDTMMVAAGTRPGPVLDFGTWRLGLAICYEVEFPEVVRSLAVRGADVVCVPTANMVGYDEVQRILLPARALENQVYLAYANYVGSEGGLDYGGLSELVDPTGRVRVAADRTEQLVEVVVERDALARARSRWSYLADRRPDLY